jgi:hypothetical protein
MLCSGTAKIPYSENDSQQHRQKALAAERLLTGEAVSHPSYEISIAEQHRRIFRKIGLPVRPTVPAARWIEHVFHLFLCQQVVHRLYAIVRKVVCPAAEPEDFQLVQRRRIRFLPFSAISAAAERGNVGKFIQMMQANG